LRAKRAILQSRVSAGLGIEVASASGVVSGGKLTSGKWLKAAGLGLRDGAKTDINVGVDCKRERTVALRKQRLESMQKQSDDDRKALRELARKRAQQLSRSDKQLKDVLRARVARWSAIVETAERHLARAESLLVYDAEARVYVSGVLSPSCTIRLSGRPVPLKDEVTAVVIAIDGHGGVQIRPHTGNGAA
jgi:uncharacterized protein (DUF342 family)